MWCVKGAGVVGEQVLGPGNALGTHLWILTQPLGETGDERSGSANPAPVLRGIERRRFRGSDDEPLVSIRQPSALTNGGQLRCPSAWARATRGFQPDKLPVLRVADRSGKPRSQGLYEDLYLVKSVMVPPSRVVGV
jgi:hypothetical protein